MRPINISECALADDLLLCAYTTKDLQDNLKIWIQELSKRGLNINVSKTKVMTTAEGNGMNIVTKGAHIKQVEASKYQGDATMEEVINERFNERM
ncbi:unnamed protein product [Acanthoscelides obtectus]|uniref:Reverse transcriptase domain-containing protein n=1 Tax=Acanthoscelides obtectus TaxID=200917 RepID=A0A9P0MF66_ACAOB|nr:unnamed protein product [Acanthoscelides obtectus]CAK1621418.1 hypothetical protein AOBTE_LOCUS940 [Acanthoscelides obtectus]